MRCRRMRRAEPGDALHAVFLAEFIDATARIDDLLLARVKRMTGRAYLDREIVRERRTRCELVATATSDFDVAVVGMDIGFHFEALLRQVLRTKGRVIYSEAPTSASPPECCKLYPQKLWIRLWMKIE